MKGPRYLLVGDVHLSDRPPSSCTDTYLDDLFAILEHTVELELNLDVEGVIWAGDVFHQRRPDRTSHRTVQRAIELVRAYRKLWIVPGNHDLAPGDRLESVMETQPLGVLLRAGARLLQGWAEGGDGWQAPDGTFRFHPVYGVPWQQEWTGGSAAAATAGWASAGADGLDVADCLMVCHAPFYPPGLELPYEYYPLQDEIEPERIGWASLMGAGHCYYGHVHEAHGVYTVKSQSGEDVTFCNQGAITRGSLAEHDVNRQVAVTTWSAEEGFTRVEVPHRPAEEVYLTTTAADGSVQLAGHARRDAAADLEGFLAGVGSAKVEVASIEGVTAHIRSMTDDEGAPLEAAVVELACALLLDASAE